MSGYEKIIHFRIIYTESLSDLLTFGVAVEVIRPHVFAEHDIIIEVDELL